MIPVIEDINQFIAQHNPRAIWKRVRTLLFPTSAFQGLSQSLRGVLNRARPVLCPASVFGGLRQSPRGILNQAWILLFTLSIFQGLLQSLRGVLSQAWTLLYPVSAGHPQSLRDILTRARIFFTVSVLPGQTQSLRDIRNRAHTLFSASILQGAPQKIRDLIHGRRHEDYTKSITSETTCDQSGRDGPPPPATNTGRGPFTYPVRVWLPGDDISRGQPVLAALDTQCHHGNIMSARIWKRLNDGRSDGLEPSQDEVRPVDSPPLEVLGRVRGVHWRWHYTHVHEFVVAEIEVYDILIGSETIMNERLLEQRV